MKPEVYTMPYSTIVQTPNVNELGLKLIKKECICGHLAYWHVYQEHDDYMKLEKQFAFLECRMRCRCKMFKQDNLKYLEELASAS